MPKTRGARVVGLLLLVAAPLAASADDRPLKAEQLTREQFDRLPDTQAIDVKGRRTTAGAIRGSMKQARPEAEAKAKAAAAKAQAEFETERTKFLEAEKAKLEAENAKVRAAVTRQAAPAQSAQLDSIRREANQLLERSKTASSAEQAQIEERAAQLLQQLRRR